MTLHLLFLSKSLTLASRLIQVISHSLLLHNYLIYSTSELSDHHFSSKCEAYRL
jgi:hypothetical protein